MADDQYLTKEYPLEDEYTVEADNPRTTAYPSSKDFPKNYDKHEERVGLAAENQDEFLVKPESKFMRILKYVFVNNIELKLAALGLAGLLWVLIAGLG